VRTIRHWDAGRNRVPWSVVRLLRLVRAGELGGLDDAWEGWTINRLGLRSPCGRVYTVQNLRHWWLVIEQARFWREGYDIATSGGVGAPAPASAGARPEAGRVAQDAADPAPAALGSLASAAAPLPRRTALDRQHATGEAPEAPGVGTAAGAADGRAGAPSSQRPDMTAAGGHGARVALIWHHEPADCGGNLGACNMEQTAPVCHPSLPPSACGGLPLANRGGNFLNGTQPDASLASLSPLPCKGVA
jgi:hypothetical protein